MPKYTDIFVLLNAAKRDHVIGFDMSAMMGGGGGGQQQQQPKQGGDNYGMYGGIIAALANTGFGVYNIVKSEEAKGEAEKANASALDSATSSDRKAVEAEAAATFAEGVAFASQAEAAANPTNKALAKYASEDAKRAAAARQTANMAMQQSMSASVGMNQTVMQDRIKSANDFAVQCSNESVTAAETASKDPKDKKKKISADQKAAKAAAASLVAARISATMMTPQSPMPPRS